MTRGTNNAGDKGTSGQNVPKSPKGPKTKKSKFRMESEQEKISKSKLRMETREDKLNRARKKLEGKKPPKPRGPVRRALGAAGWSAHGFVHGKVYEVEHENVGTEGAHRSELLGEAVLRQGTRYAKKRIREHPARAVHKAEAQYIKARADYQFRMAAQENPELAKNAVTRYWHKQKLKKQYAKQARQAAKQTTKQGAKAAGKTAAATEKLAERAVAFVKRHPVGALIALACVVLVLSLQSCASSLITLGNAAAGAVGATTYPAQDGDMLGAEAAYCSLEAELQHYLDTYESTHDYDEYHYDLDAIEHDPYVLVSILSAWHEGEWTLADVQPTLQMLFDRQYTLTENVVKERRYYIETDTWTDEEGNTHTDSYRVYYDYYICTVTLDNFNLSHLPIYIMGEEKVSRYSLYMATLGNRPDLFPGSSYVGKYTSPPEGYEVPGEYLDDETFAAMLSEAEKYLGYPYVWGGSSPATSFDCSGFVSWVINHSGWNVGRLGAQGLYNICTRTSSPRPGDLVFFKGTYDTPGVSHCGIYVGDGMMLHCGDPISYANLNSSYWQAHFYAYGRLP
ncbi:NlpC/P60 family protein [bacterium 1XD42-1]|nr:NlpC/P60 family protein [bacterium 1XD42-8]RKJ61711.1 NlpC/P60 family protein [bacterium 1XD42-1]